MACGFEGKECAICGAGNGCVAAMNDDYFFPATKEDLVERLDTGKYPAYRDLMIKTLKDRFGFEYGKDILEKEPVKPQDLCCVDIRELRNEKRDLVMDVLLAQSQVISDQQKQISELEKKIEALQIVMFLTPFGYNDLD